VYFGLSPIQDSKDDLLGWFSQLKQALRYSAGTAASRVGSCTFDQIISASAKVDAPRNCFYSFNFFNFSKIITFTTYLVG
jgi:hypothetical protein